MVALRVRKVFRFKRDRKGESVFGCRSLRKGNHSFCGRVVPSCVESIILNFLLYLIFHIIQLFDCIYKLVLSFVILFIFRSLLTFTTNGIYLVLFSVRECMFFDNL